MSKQTTRNRINKLLHALPVYHEEIPLDAIFKAVSDNGGTVVQEDGTQWAGLLCGTEGRANMRVIFQADRPKPSFIPCGSDMWLYVGWYEMASGRFEVTSYIS